MRFLLAPPRAPTPSTPGAALPRTHHTKTKLQRHTVGGKTYMINHFEDPQPATEYVSELAQDAKGNMRMVDTRAVPDANVGGQWFTCSGSKTPWNTHLGSEEVCFVFVCLCVCARVSPGLTSQKNTRRSRASPSLSLLTKQQQQKLYSSSTRPTAACTSRPFWRAR